MSAKSSKYSGKAWILKTIVLFQLPRSWRGPHFLVPICYTNLGPVSQQHVLIVGQICSSLQPCKTRPRRPQPDTLHGGFICHRFQTELWWKTSSRPSHLKPNQVQLLFEPKWVQEKSTALGLDQEQNYLLGISISIVNWMLVPSMRYWWY